MPIEYNPNRKPWTLEELITIVDPPDVYSKPFKDYLPNFAEQPVDEVVNSWCASAHPRYLYRAKYKWAIFHFYTLQGGGYSGQGTVIGYGSPKPAAGRFAICTHKNEYLASANPHRGFHDQRCTLCGLDTSYDSSD